MKISIIIPMYKVEAFIEKCLTSCIKQDISEKDYEIVCVNDGSPDNSAVIAREMAKKYTNIIVKDRENGGLSAARNTGLKHAKGDYVWFVDSDDWIKENCLKKIVETCEQHNLDMLRICAANMYGDKAVRRFSYPEEVAVEKGRDILKQGIVFCAPFSIYRRQFLLDNNLWFYEGIFHEDNEFTPRAFFKAERVGALNDLLYFVYQNPNSITRSFNPKKAFDNIIVMNSLHDFQQREDPGTDNAFNYVITGTMNAALHEAIEFDKEKQREFAEALYGNRNLYTHLLHSGRTIYYLEGILLKIFPKHPIEVYQFMNLFDRRSIKTKKQA
ncbi:MAG: glycosyltransferase [Bacteroidales bacterium]|nr:glycosyltransferase [Bacteroidales bacterium]